MFCTQCGKELKHGEEFCPSCGRAVKSKASKPPKQEVVQLHGQNMGKVLYESKGYPVGYSRKVKIIGIVAIIGGIVIMLMSQARHSSSQVNYYAGGNLVDTGTIGGGSMFTAEGSQSLLLIGGLMVIIGIFLFGFIKKLNESYALTLYERGMEGIKMGQKFVLMYSQVTEVLCDEPASIQAVTIVTMGNKYRVIVAQGAEETANIIRNRVRM